jgi:hypothetical protein
LWSGGAADDPQAFANAVLRMRDRRADLVEMGRRARRLEKSEFSRATIWEINSSALETTYREFRHRRAQTSPVLTGDQEYISHDGRPLMPPNGLTVDVEG